jgi:hypothetical protein
MSAAEAARVLEIVEPEKEIEAKALPIPSQAKAIAVIDNTTMVAADNMQETIRLMIKKIDDTFKPMAQKAFEAHRAITGKWNAIKAPLDEASRYLVSQVKTYKRKLEEEEAAERRRIEEEARKKAEEEALAEAERLEQEGFTEEAEAVISEPVHYAAPKFTSSAPKVDNRKYRTVWKAEVTDKIVFIIFVADMLKKVPELKKQGRHAEAQVYAEYAQALEASPSWLNKKAVAQGKNLCMAGIRAYEA